MQLSLKKNIQFILELKRREKNETTIEHNKVGPRNINLILVQQTTSVSSQLRVCVYVC